MGNATTNSSLSALGTKVRSLRNELGLSQEELASSCGFDRTYISLVERGKRNISFNNLQTLSAGLGTNLSKLTRGL